MLLVSAECSSLIAGSGYGSWGCQHGFPQHPLSAPHSAPAPGSNRQSVLVEEKLHPGAPAPAGAAPDPPAALPCSPGAGCCFIASSWPTATPP